MSRPSSKSIEQKKCSLCNRVKPEYRCMILINCRHMVCRSCLALCLNYCGSSGIRCPVAGCEHLLEEVEIRDILEHTRPSIELAPVANHWNWNSKSEEKTSSGIEKKVEYSSYFSSEDFPNLPSSSSVTSKDPENSRSYKYRNVMDEPVPSGLKSGAAGSQNQKHSDAKDWDPMARVRLRKLIADKMHKTVDLVFVATKADLSFNQHPVECFICQDHISTYEGVSFPYCSSYFCRTCLTQPESRANDVILLYSDYNNKSKNCAVIIDGEMRSFFQKSIPVRTNTVRSLVSIYENENVKHSHHDKRFDSKKDCTNSGPPSKSLDTTSNKVIGRTSQLDTISDVVLFRNSSSSLCELCSKKIKAEKGVILRNCFHVLCEGCLIETIMETLETGVEVHCPMMLDNRRRCKTIVQEREIKSLLSAKQYQIYENKCLEAAEDDFSSIVHCLKPKCIGWIVIEGYKESFVCPVCCSVNCLSCQAIHQGKTCNAYQTALGLKDEKDLSLKAKLMALDAQHKPRCPKCRSDHLNPPRCNFIRCKDCDNVFSLPTSDSKK